MKKTLTSGFTVIELMIAIIVFTLGFLSAYMLVDTAMSAAINGKNEIIATNLAREQIEIFKNLRDTNWLQNRTWTGTEAMNGTNKNIFDPSSPASFNELIPGYYLIENYQTVANQPTISLKKLTVWNNWIPGTKPDFLDQAQLCFKDTVYTHECGINQKIPFYSFIQVEDLKESGTTVPNALRLTSVVATTQRGYREYVVRTILTDWKR